MRDDTVTKQLKVQFSETEMQDIAKSLVGEITGLEATKEEKKTEDSAFKERIDRHTAEINTLARRYAKGYEMEDVECDIRYNSPEPGKKTLIRMDNGETVETLDMTNDEKQEEIQFNLENQVDTPLTVQPADDPPEEDAAGAGV